MDALSAALSGVRVKLAGGGDLLEELAAKYECDYPAAPPGDAAGPRSPLLWYGQLAPPALKEAQADFKSGAQQAAAGTLLQHPVCRPLGSDPAPPTPVRALQPWSLASTWSTPGAKSSRA